MGQIWLKSVMIRRPCADGVGESRDVDRFRDVPGVVERGVPGSSP